MLGGDIRRPPDWDFVRRFVTACVAHARQHENTISVPADAKGDYGIVLTGADSSGANDSVAFRVHVP